MADVKQCISCKRLLDQPDDPRSLDCGGDCRQCMADAGDPDCIESLRGAEPSRKAASSDARGGAWW